MPAGMRACRLKEEAEACVAGNFRSGQACMCSLISPLSLLLVGSSRTEEGVVVASKAVEEGLVGKLVVIHNMVNDAKHEQ